MIIQIDPRNLDRPHSLESHRPDLPTYGDSPRAGDLQVDALWSYAGQPGGWYVPPAPVPEPATWMLMAIGLFTLLTFRKLWRIALCQ